jgi:antirestriction protein ArdC
MNQDRKENRQDVYSSITNRIVAELENGVRPWMKPWNAEHAAGRITRRLRHNGVPYQGINILSLWMDATLKGFAAPIWMTYRQALELGGHVRKGEHGSLVVHANSITKSEANAQTGEETAQQIYFLKGYTVFNAEQIEGLPAQYYALAEKPLDSMNRIEHAENFFAATGASITHGGNRAFYRPSTDQIVMPPFEAFRDAESYYATLAHETTHWTMHASRLDRDFSREYGSKRFGSQAYAIEELVAELGSAFLCADLGLALEPREDHAAYIASWLEALKNDKHAIFTAASHAQRAADFINCLAAQLEGTVREKNAA